MTILVLEYMESGSLVEFIKTVGVLEENLSKRVFYQILCGLKHTHELGIIHWDIKGANILLDKNLNAKISDYGIAKNRAREWELNEGENTLVGTPYWMAPEIIQGKKDIDYAVDIWSLGATLIEALTGKPPYEKCNHYQAFIKILEDEHPELPENISD